MAGRCAAIAIAAVLGGLLATLAATGSALAETVPLPKPAPLPKTGVAPQPAASVPPSASAAPSASNHSHGFFPFSFSLPSPFGHATSNAAAFTPAQRQLLDRISTYLSSVQTLEGNFVQINPDGGVVRGTFYLEKPGKLRFHYNPPTPIDLVADGSSVVIINRRLDTQQLYPLSQTPLRYLLAERINLLRDTDVVSVSSDPKTVTVVIKQKVLMVGTSRIKITFNAEDLTLEQWTVTDPTGQKVTDEVYNLDPTAKPNPNLFVINYRRNSENELNDQ